MYNPNIEEMLLKQSKTIGTTESLFQRLKRFPNVGVDTLQVTKTTFDDLGQRVKDIGTKLGRQPVVAVFCRAGIYRSQVIAERLENNKLAEISLFNWDLEAGQITGAGMGTYEVQRRLDIDNDGGMTYANDPPEEPFDIMVLAVSQRVDKLGDRLQVTRVSNYFNERLPETSQQRPVNIIWVQGTEEEVQTWFPE